MIDEDCVGGRVWFDVPIPATQRGNSLQDPGESGLVGAMVQLRVGTTVMASVLTDANGSYQFDNVPAGAYNLMAKGIPGATRPALMDVGGDDTIDSDFTSTATPTTAEFVLPADGSIDRDAGFTTPFED
jgi:hypothetical protein